MKDINVPTQVAILQGDCTEREKNEATRQLVNRFNRTLFYFILKMVRQKQDAEDALQQIWTKAFQRIDQYSASHSFSTWLFKLATNHVIDLTRKRALNTIDLGSPLTNEPNDDDLRSNKLMMSMADSNPNPEEQLQLDARKEMVHDLINMLKPQLREIVVLRFFEELSYEEIAERTGKPLGTVKGNLYRAKEKLEAFAMDLNLQEQF